MYINTTIIPLMTWSTTFVSLPSFSKILNIHIRNGSMFIMYSSNTYSHNSDGGKTYNIRVLTGLEINNQEIPDCFQFLNMVKIIENDFIEYYHIFIEEIKTLAEIRDSKIEEVIK